MALTSSLKVSSNLCVLGVVLASAVLLRFWDLDRTSLWLDESASWRQVNQAFFDMLRATARDNYPPLHNIFLWLQVKLFGDGEASLRFPSALFGAASVIAIGALGRVLWDARTGLTAATILALHPLAIWHAQDARMYTLLSSLSIGFVWAVARYLQTPSAWRALATFVTAAALLMTHIYGSFVYLSINLFVTAFLFVYSSQLRRPLLLWIAAQSTAAIVFCPWLIKLFGRASVVVANGFWIPYPDASFIWQTARDALSDPLLLVGVILLFVLLSLKIRTFHLHRAHRESSARSGTEAWALPLILVWLTSPVALALVLSFVVQPILISRYLICVTPAAILMIAVGLTKLYDNRPIASIALFAILLVLMVPSAIHTAVVERHTHNDWRSLANIHSSNRQSGDGTIFYKPYLVHPYAYYGGSISPLDRPRSLSEATQPPETDQRLWLVSRRLEEPERSSILQGYENAGRELLGEWSPYGLTLLLFGTPLDETPRVTCLPVPTAVGEGGFH